MSYTKIKLNNLSGVRRLPRLGKIRLGVKVKNSQGKEYPRETDYFVVPEEIRDVYGEMPKELDILIPVENDEVSFPQALKFYGSSRGLKCKGDGETALERDD